ncbi:unnamed protein product [Phytophthora lilii]|uniref:Fructose-1,6-bisphosphatase, cytosolic n=1 Tax=Phytophthora lilii TaxID=2077276 RepID=A0A9W6TGL3_9STRA|nr:unnamed protein product [Phytophthora lilii]
MYGSSTQLVLTWGKGVHCFTLDPTIGAFILSQKDIRIPDEPKTIYSCNEGNYAHWDRATKAFVDECKTKPKPYAARYVGSMVSDIHRTILYGGIYLYPGSDKSKDGKLRLLYECNPMSFIMEQAGGMSTTGTERILDLVPTDIHQRSPIFLGCKRDADAEHTSFHKVTKQIHVDPNVSLPSARCPSEQAGRMLYPRHQQSTTHFNSSSQRRQAHRHAQSFAALSSTDHQELQGHSRFCHVRRASRSSSMAAQVDHSNPITLSRFILAEKEIQGNTDLSVLFTSIELACKVIASSVRRAGLTGLYGLDGSENATGDQVKKLDVLANDIFVNSLKFSTKIEVMVSEEEEKPIVVQNDSTGSECWNRWDLRVAIC